MIFLLLVFLREGPPQDFKLKKLEFLPQVGRETEKMGGTEMEKRRNKDKKRGWEGEKSTGVDMLREDKNALTYIPLQEGRKTTGNIVVGEFRERDVGVETRTTTTVEEGRETCKLGGMRAAQ